MQSARVRAAEPAHIKGKLDEQDAKNWATAATARVVGVGSLASSTKVGSQPGNVADVDKDMVALVKGNPLSPGSWVVGEILR